MNNRRFCNKEEMQNLKDAGCDVTDAFHVFVKYKFNSDYTVMLRDDFNKADKSDMDDYFYSYDMSDLLMKLPEYVADETGEAKMFLQCGIFSKIYYTEYIDNTDKSKDAGCLLASARSLLGSMYQMLLAVLKDDIEEENWYNPFGKVNLNKLNNL